MSTLAPQPAETLRHDGEALAAGFPGLLAEASQLAATINMGTHGRRRAGPGDATMTHSAG